MTRSLIRFSTKTLTAEPFFLAVERPYHDDTLTVLRARHAGLFTYSVELEFLESGSSAQVSPALPDFWLPQDWRRFLDHVDALAGAPKAATGRRG